jgi:2-iminobutanoate/2-iminopropanoate deaminase
MPHKAHNIGVAAQIGKYSDAIETAPNMRWLHTSGTPGLLHDKQLPPDITGQAERAWEHILAILREADMAIDDIVKVTQYLTRAEDVADYAKVRSRVLGEARPAFMLLVVPQLIWPEVLLEIEVIAAKATDASR